MLKILIMLVIGVAAAGTAQAAPPPNPVDPAVRGEWLAFAWIDLQPLARGGDDSPRAATAELLRGALSSGLGALGVPSEGDQRVLKESLDAAVGGAPVAIWLVPAVPGERSAVNARIWSPDGSTRDVGEQLPTEDHRLRMYATVLGPEGFAEWPAHRQAVGGVAPAGEPLIELAFNVDAIRQQCPSEFAGSSGVTSDGGGMRGHNLLGALRVANARVLGLHARLIPADAVSPRDPALPRIGATANATYAGPPLLIVEASWSARSQPPGTVHHAALTLPYWPVAQLGTLGPNEAAFVLAARASWRPVVDRVLDVYHASLPPATSPAFASLRQRWLTSHGDALGRLISGTEPWVAWSCQLRGDDRGRLAWRVRLRPDASPEGASRLLDELTVDLGQFRAAESGAACARSQPSPRWAGLAVRWCVDGSTPGSPATIRGTLGFETPPAR